MQKLIRISLLVLLATLLMFSAFPAPAEAGGECKGFGSIWTCFVDLDGKKFKYTCHGSEKDCKDTLINIQTGKCTVNVLSTCGGHQALIVNVEVFDDACGCFKKY